MLRVKKYQKVIEYNSHILIICIFIVLIENYKKFNKISIYV